MTDENRLKAVLQRASIEGLGHSAASPQKVLSQILDEIDAIVLPRDLTLENGTGQGLSLTVKSRRLIRVNAPVPRALGALPGVVDAELDGSGDQMTALAHLLAAFAALTTDLSTSTSKPARPEVLMELGVPVGSIQTAIGNAGYALEEAKTGVFDSLTEIAQDQAEAWLLISAGAVNASGGDTDVLLDIVENTLPYLVKTERPQSEGTQTWVFGADDAHSVVVTVYGSQCIIAQLPSELTQAWVSAHAGKSAD